MTNGEILMTAMAQSAVDSNCAAADFLAKEHKIVLSQKNEKARSYLELPFQCDLTSYGSNIVASVAPELTELVETYLSHYLIEHCFETPSIYDLNQALRPFDLAVCFMAEYFLPDITVLKSLPCSYEMRVLEPAAFAQYYLPEWSNALCEERAHLDKVGVGAYDGDKLIGLAACSSDCDTMWQIGVDVLPQYRLQGVAAAITAKLGIEILARGVVPFYCCAWSNIKSVRNAIKSGFKPAWVQLTVKQNTFIDKMRKAK